MKHEPSRISGLTALAHKLEQFPRVIDGTGMLLLNGQWQGIPTWAGEVLQDCTQEIESITGLKVHHVAVNVILPGGGSGWHVDPTPKIDDQFVRFSRWHLPIQTNLDAWFEDSENPRFHMQHGMWHGPIRYWLPHAVGNDGITPRMHLLCDLK